MNGEGYNKCKYCKNWEMKEDSGFSEIEGHCLKFDRVTEAREVCKVGANVRLLDKLVATFKETNELEAITIFIAVGMILEILIAVVTPLWLTIILNVIIVVLIGWLVEQDLL